jgi:PAS domain S-box-containing protein
LTLNYLQKELYEKVRADEAIFNFLQESVLDGLWYWDLENPEDEWMNPRFWTTLGYDPDKMPHKASAWQDIINREDLNTAIDNFQKHCADPNHPYDQLVRYRHKNGSTVWIRCRGMAIRDENGKPIRMLGAHHEITEHKLIEAQLRISEKQFRGAFENSAIGMALVSTEGKWLKVNHQLCYIVGYTERELMQKTFQDITHPDDLEKDLGLVKDVLDNKISNYKMEKRYFHSAGHIVWVLLSVSLVRDSNGEPLHFVSQIENITERKKAIQQLHEANERLQLATASSDIGIWEYNVKTNFLVWDDAMFRIYGVKKENFSAAYDAWRNGLHPEDAERGDKEVEMALNGTKDFDTEFRIVWPDKSIRYIKAKAIVIRNDKGEAEKMIGTNSDITEQKKMEGLHRRMATLESKSKEMEEFAYVTSHDLREPLLTIRNYIDLLFEDHQAQLNPEATAFLNTIQGAAKRMDELILNLLDYSRLSREKKLEKVDCNALLNELLKELDPLLKDTGANITIKNLPVLKAYPKELKLAFHNLITNALKFNKEGTQSNIAIYANQVEYGWEFAVRDNGIGIPPEDLEKIFIIFRKLHHNEAFSGTGIGLALVKKIAEIHNGSAWAKSNEENGSTFYFTVLTEVL